MSCFSATEAKDQEVKECCICFDEIGCKNNCVTPCGHYFCFNCVTRALSNSNTCPMCRTVLIEIPEEDEEEDSDYESDEEEDEDDQDEEEGDGNIEDVHARFMKLGYTSMDIMSMLTGRYKRSDPKYTSDYIDKMVKDFESIIDDVDNEEDEREMMGGEDRQSVVDVV